MADLPIDPSLAVSDVDSTFADTTATFNVLANDLHTRGAPILVSASLPDASDGTLTFTAAGAIIFTPDAATFESLGIGQFAVVPITYTLNEGGFQSTAVFNMTVLGVNDAPVGHADAATVAAEHTVTIDVLANDTDPDATDLHDVNGDLILGISGFTQPVDAQGNPVGTLIQGAAADGHTVFIYTASDSSLDAGDHTVTFTYVTQDQWGATSSPTTVTIDVTGNSTPGETCNGGNHPQALVGGGGNDVLSGGNDKDTVGGAAGADTLHGNNGDDSVAGGDGNDRLYGDNGVDTLDGGNGDDTLTGGNGHDLFVFGFHFGHDVVTDFDKDTLQVHPAEWGSFSDLMAHAVQSGTSVVITSDDGHDTLTLLNTLRSSLSSGEFLFN
ncbi:MAG TPA: Ig-like domain-containing protein [Phenylobacterium sp.]|nr:Ig-like domain-containing protein [Phenylobacterium sp.]